MHDDFFGQVQPETRILFDLTGREKPDLMLNMHCGVGRTNPFINIFTPCKYNTPPLMPVVADSLRNFVYPELIVRGYNKIKDVKDMHKAKHNMSARVNLILLQETMKFLSRTGGVEFWQKIFKKR